MSPAREAFRKGEREQAKRSALSDSLRCRFDICDVDRLGLLVQGSRNLYLLPGERRRLFLVAQLVERLVRIEQYVFTASLHARLRTHLRIVSTHLLEHRFVPPTLGTRIIHDLPFEGCVLGRRQTGREQKTCTDTHY
jgi:hypothetical protein